MDFSLKAVFGLDTTNAETGLKKLRTQVNDVASKWGSIGLAAAGAAFVALSKSAIELGSNLSDQAMQLGINVEKLQVLNSVARDAGVSQETVSKAIIKTRTAASQAEQGLATYKQAFENLNINTKQFLALPAEERMVAIAKAYKNATDKNAAYNSVAQIFGEKVGPKMMEVLGQLSGEGFPKLEKAAKKAGDVMSAETIAALDKAGDEIEAFKQRITIAIGNIIVNFRSEEGLKLLGLQFLTVVGTFGAGISDAITEAGEMVWAVLKGAFKGVINYFQDGLVTVVQGLAEMVNRLLPAKFQINIGNLDQFRSSGKGIADEITTAIASTAPATLKKDVAAYWDKAIADQQNVVDQLNKVDFGEAAKTLRNAGDDLTRSGIVAAQALADGGKQAAAPILDAARALSTSISRNGTPYESQSTSALQGVLQRLNDQYFDARTRSPNASVNSPNGADYGAGVAINFFKAEMDRVQAELNLRKTIGGVVNQYGEQEAIRRFGDDAVSRSLRDLQDTSERGTSALERISRGLAAQGLLPPG
jgi:hypothetical protein